jgi:hypothetical protein
MLNALTERTTVINVMTYIISPPILLLLLEPKSKPLVVPVQRLRMELISVMIMP